MNLDEILQLQVLKLKALQSGRSMQALTEHFIETNEVPELRQMCAKVSVQLYTELDQVCGLLDMTKRDFIEAAVSDALTRAGELLKRSGALEQGSL